MAEQLNMELLTKLLETAPQELHEAAAYLALRMRMHSDFAKGFVLADRLFEMKRIQKEAKDGAK